MESLSTEPEVLTELNETADILSEEYNSNPVTKLTPRNTINFAYLTLYLFIFNHLIH